MGAKASTANINVEPQASSIGNNKPPERLGSPESKGNKITKGASSEPLLATEERPMVRRRSSLMSLEPIDLELKKWDEQYDDPKYFYGGITVLFFVSYAFARIIGLNSEPPYGPVPLGKILSSYVIFTPLAFLLRTVSRVRLLSVLFGGIAVGILWSIVQVHQDKIGVDMSIESMECCWSGYHFLIFGCAAVALVLGMKNRYDEVKEAGSWKWNEAKDVIWTLFGLVLVIIGWLAGASLHIPSWFIGFALTLGSASLRGTSGAVTKAVGFGLFLHGAACWGVGDIFETKVVTTTTISPMTEEVENFVPLGILGGALIAFFGAKYKGFF